MTGAEVAVEDDTASGGGSLSSTPARKLSARLAKFAYSPARRTGLKAEEGSPSVKPSPFVSPSPSPRKKQRDSNHPAGATPESTASSPGPSRAAHGQGDAESDGSELHELTPTRRKLKKVPRGYAAPETYDHLLGIPDYLAPGLSVIFCGINPGKMSSIRQHHFAHPSNKFWKALADAGFTDRLRACGVDDACCVDMFGFGLTNLVPRVTSEQAELSTAEMRQCVPLLLAKLAAHRPRVCCLVGKKIWDIFESVVKKSARAAEGADEAAGAAKRRSGRGGDEDDKAVVKQEDGPERLTRTRFATFQPSPPPDPDPDAAEQDIKPEPVAGAFPSPRKFGTSNSVAFGWDQPRAYVLPHADETDDPDQPGQGRQDDAKPAGARYTMFWVVPSTSGLERTPYAELVRHFQNLKKLADLLEHDELDWRTFRHIDVKGVGRTVAEIKLREAEKSAKTEPSLGTE